MSCELVHEMTAYEKAVYRRNKIASELLLRRLVKAHQELASQKQRDRTLPSTIVGDPVIKLGEAAWQSKNGKRYVGEQGRMILEAVAGYYQIAVAGLKADRRTARYTKPRHVAMYLCEQLTNLSYPSIGRLLHRDHATVLHGCKTMAMRIENDPALAIQVATIRAQIAELKFSRPPQVLPNARRFYEKFDWSEHRVQRLVDLRKNQKLPFDEIAHLLGDVSMNACKNKYARVSA